MIRDRLDNTFVAHIYFEAEGDSYAYNYDDSDTVEAIRVIVLDGPLEGEILWLSEGRP